MNYITSCPKCETNFLLNDALIKANRGKVQCGTCEHVFNAKTRLTEVADGITSANEYQASLEAPEVAQGEEIILGDNASLTADYDVENDTDIVVESEPTLDIHAPSIFDDLDRKTDTANKTTKHSLLWGAFSLLLILLAASQTIYHQRVKIAAEHPQFKPLLMKACSHLSCSIDLPRDLDFITIGDSDMQENDHYQSVINFTSSLTNTANYPQAYPNILLTLTNEDNHTVIKKHIKPEDYLPADQKVKDGIAGHGVRTIKLPLYVHESVVAGYRILLIYP